MILGLKSPNTPQFREQFFFTRGVIFSQTMRIRAWHSNFLWQLPLWQIKFIKYGIKLFLMSQRFHTYLIFWLVSTKKHFLAIFLKILTWFSLFAVSICIRMLTKMPPVRYERDEDEWKPHMSRKQITQAIQWCSQNCFIFQRFQATAAYMERCKIICIQNCRFSPFFRGKLQIFGH